MHAAARPREVSCHACATRFCIAFHRSHTFQAWSAHAQVACSPVALISNLVCITQQTLFRDFCERSLSAAAPPPFTARFHDVFHSLLHRDARRKAYIGARFSSEGSVRCGECLCNTQLRPCILRFMVGSIMLRNRVRIPTHESRHSAKPVERTNIFFRTLMLP